MTSHADRPTDWRTQFIYLSRCARTPWEKKQKWVKKNNVFKCSHLQCSVLGYNFWILFPAKSRQSFFFPNPIKKLMVNRGADSARDLAWHALTRGRRHQHHDSNSTCFISLSCNWTILIFLTDSESQLNCLELGQLIFRFEAHGPSNMGPKSAREFAMLNFGEYVDTFLLICDGFAGLKVLRELRANQGASLHLGFFFEIRPDNTK